MTDPKLRIEGLTKRFGNETAVTDLSTSVASGDFHSILGPSGCGKTTTLRCVAGLEQPDSGRIYIDDELVSAPDQGVHVKPKHRGIGMVFQEYAVWPHLTVAENVAFPLEVRDIGDSDHRRERVREMPALVGLEDRLDDLATNLSGGQQQRVAISRALVTEPAILLFDEPLSHLDAKLRREMRVEIEQICTELDITTLYVTHDQDEAMYLSDRISLMRGGSLVEENDPVSLHTAPKTLFGMNFMGQCNVLAGEIASVEADSVTVATSTASVRAPRESFVGQPREGQTVQVCFRPKYCTFDGDSAVTFSGEVDSVSQTGDFVEYEVTLEEDTVRVRLLEYDSVDPGDCVDIAVDSGQVRMYATPESEEAPEPGCESLSAGRPGSS